MVELQGGANHYYVKRISEIVDTEGLTAAYPMPDPSQVSNFTSSDVGTEDVSSHTLISHKRKVNKAGEEWNDEQVTKVNSKTVTTRLMSLKSLEAKSLVITGWSSTKS